MLVTPAFAVPAPAKLPTVVVFAPCAKAPKPSDVAPPDTPEVAPVAIELRPHATSCWLVATEPPPACGSPPLALPPQTNWAEAGSDHRIVNDNTASAKTTRAESRQRANPLTAKSAKPILQITSPPGKQPVTY